MTVQVQMPSEIKLQRFYRPEDIGKDESYQAGFWDVYATPGPSAAASWVHWVDVDSVVRKCAVKAAGAGVPEGKQSQYEYQNVAPAVPECHPGSTRMSPPQYQNFTPAIPEWQMEVMW